MTAGVRYVILAEFTPYDPVAAAAVTVRACSVDDARVTSLNGVAWWPAISAAPRRTLDLFDGEFGGKISAGIGDIEIALAAFPNAARYAWGERPVKLWRGVLGAAWGGYTLIFEGLTRPPRASNGRMRIGLRVDDRWLDKPLLSTYAGTGSAEGPADLKGQPKPLALGAPQFVEGVIINRALNIVQLHGAGAINGITAAFDRLARFGASAGNDASYAAIAAASVAPGTWRSCTALGLVRFGAPPAGVAAFHVEGDSGSALGWVRTPGQVIRRIALIAGATAGQIDATSLAALDSACPYNISVYLRDQTTAREIIQSIAASCNAAAGVSWLGKLFVVRATIGSPAITLAIDGSSLPPVAATEMLEASAPFWRTALEGERTERVHSAGEYGVAAAAPAGDEMNLNSSFELFETGQFPGWTIGAAASGGGGFSQSTLNGGRGLYSVRLVGATLASSVPIPVSPGEKLWIELYLTMENGRNGANPGTSATVFAAANFNSDGTNTTVGTQTVLLNESRLGGSASTGLIYPITVPSGVNTLWLSFTLDASAGSLASCWLGNLSASRRQPGADVTAAVLADDATMIGTTDPITVGDLITAATTAAASPVAPKAITALGASAALDVVIPAGASRTFSAEVFFNLTAGSIITLSTPLESRIGTGSWSGFGSSTGDTDTAVAVLFASATGTLTNSGGDDLNYQVRAVPAAPGGTGTVDASRSILRAA